MYQVRRVNIGKTEQLDELARECGKLYSQTLVFFWRTVRHKGVWLTPKHLMRLFTTSKLHAHTADACVQAFFASLKSWRKRKKQGDPDAHPPHRRKWYFRIEYKRSAMKLENKTLRLSNGKGNEPLMLIKRLCVVKANERDWQHGYIENSRAFGRVTCNAEAIRSPGDDENYGEAAGYAGICCGS